MPYQPMFPTLTPPARYSFYSTPLLRRTACLQAHALCYMAGRGVPCPTLAMRASSRLHW